ncbi:MAG: glycoside hydrolase family 3 N-terminal domain-containing protein, partial [Bacteroidota bacterium]
LFMIRAQPSLGATHLSQVEAQVRKYKVGGICFFQGTSNQYVDLVNRYQSASDINILMAIDAEWGLNMRIKNVVSYPKQLTLGAIQNNRLLYDMGTEVAGQLKRVGMHVNFAPVADVNNNPDNPVINYRSFGEDRYNVTIKSYMYMKGMQDNNLLGCAKHFPGHGDTDVDSHLDLPVILHDKNRLDSIELYPFKVLSSYGVGSMMVAHLNIPTIDNRENRPTTLSKSTVTDLLKNELNFKGLIFTDALEMKGVAKYYESGEVEAEALLAGNDMLVLPEDLAAALKTIKAYLDEGKIEMSRLEESVKKILFAKYQLGLNKPFETLKKDNIQKDLNNVNATTLIRKLYQEAMTMVRNKDQMIPLLSPNNMKLASVSIGASKQTTFQNRLSSYGKFDHNLLSKKASTAQQDQLIAKLASKDLVVVGLHDMSYFSKSDYGLTESMKSFVSKLNQRTKVVLVVFGTPYSLKYFDEIDWLLEAYEENEVTQELAAQSLFGVFGLKGRLPVTSSLKSSYNVGVNTKPSFRLGFARPEQMGLNPDTLKLVDAIARSAIASRATPGCVVLVAKDGHIVHHKAYGYHTYSKRKKMEKGDIFDVASVTKIAATTLSVMKLRDKGKLDIDVPLGAFLDELAGTNKEQLIIKDVMAHHGGLISWIPFYEQTMSKGRRYRRKPLSKFYRKIATTGFEVPVTNSLFLRNDYVDSIKYKIINSNLRSNNNYRYSDLGFYLMADVVERTSGKPLNEYVMDEFYKPMGLTTTNFNAWKTLPMNKVVPSENDRYFRKQVVKGYVHDMGAAMLGGVSGHAGLFSDAEGLAMLMQMLLQGGYYGGKRYLTNATVEEFTKRHSRSTRRGIGFDMPELNVRKSQNVADKASHETFGHLGFTGTCVWADPENDLVYIFLSNRTYPSMYNYKLSKNDYRPRIHNVIYRSIVEKKTTDKDLFSLNSNGINN